MRVHYLQHVEFEGIGVIDDWVRARGPRPGTHLFRSPEFPDPDDLDFLVVMGGPMNIYEHEAYPWLQPEKTFIRSAVDSGKAVIGICLGAQLIADVLGAPVTKGSRPEIGWFPVTLMPQAATAAASVFADFPSELTAFHAHGDTFAIPAGAVHAASSAACANQAFAYDGGRVVGLQFHIESTPALVAGLVSNSRKELARLRDEPWVQDASEMQSPDAPYETCWTLLYSLLDRMAAQ